MKNRYLEEKNIFIKCVNLLIKINKEIIEKPIVKGFYLEQQGNRMYENE